MASKFEIIFSCTSREKRPPVSYKLREYYASFIEENLLNSERVKINEKWNINFSVLFVEEGPRFTSTEISLAKKPRLIKSENVKLYEVVIPLKKILENNQI